MVRPCTREGPSRISQRAQAWMTSSILLNPLVYLSPGPSRTPDLAAHARRSLHPSQPGAVHAGPTHFGPSAEACTPWLQIALGCSAQAGLQGVVLVCGQRLWHLPPQLQAASHVLLWPWDMESVRALVSSMHGFGLG